VLVEFVDDRDGAAMTSLMNRLCRWLSTCACGIAG
jgi:hypothetical protein